MPGRALLIGINEYRNVGGLRGCVNDVTNLRNILLTHFGYSPDTVSILTDSSAVKPRILSRMEWLLDGARKGDQLVIQFSGHGSTIRDIDGDERARKLEDQLDEILCLHDMDFRDPGTYFVDDEIHEWVKRLPRGVELTFFIDACHSGTITRDLGFASSSVARCTPSGTTSAPGGPLQGQRGARPVPLLLEAPWPWAHAAVPPVPDRVGRYLAPPVDIAGRVDERRDMGTRRMLHGSSANHLLLAACREDQTAADALIDGSYNGAFTYYACGALRASGGEMTVTALLSAVRQSVRHGGYDQVPQARGKGLHAGVFRSAGRGAEAPG